MPRPKAPPVSLAPLVELPGQTLKEQVRDALIRSLTEGYLAPDCQITLRAISSNYGTSIMPVREAVRELASRHALDLLPNRTIRVPRLPRSEFHQVWRLRRLLEGEACANAAVLCGAHAMTRIRAKHEASLAAIASGDEKEIIRAGKAFLFSIYAETRDPILISFIETLWLRSAPLFKMTSDEGHREMVAAFKSSTPNDLALIDALDRSDADHARLLRQKDLYELGQFISRYGVLDDSEATESSFRA